MKRIWTRWLPAAAVPAVVAVAALAGGAAAVSPPPPSTPEQVLALMASHASRPQFSGTIEERANLGLPSIPSQALGPATKSSTLGAEAAFLELLTTAHTARVFVNGPMLVRVQVMDQLAERDFIRAGSDWWTFDSKTNAVTHATIPTHGIGSDGNNPAEPGTAPKAPVVTPDQLAQRFLAAADASTNVTLGPSVTVAGHAAYELVLTPKASGTLVGSVQIAVEAQTGMPLGVDVYAKGQKDPAYHEAFTQLDLKAPDASIFMFTPPPGATVTQVPDPAKEGTQKAPSSTAPSNTAPKAPSNTAPKAPSNTAPSNTAPPSTAPKAPSNTAPSNTAPPSTAPKAPSNTAQGPTIIGKGWDAVVVIPAGDVPVGVLDTPLVKQLATPVAGGRVLSSSLLNIFLTDDGRVIAGAVPVATLIATAK
ncbi:hypothetical protein [Sinomonas sp. ASV322]|uniref:hypothetical protein n=1 Tax=Sinomonas sp. ASV322 TaxID=3041920 RepID=UPI0027DC99A8|nr:hypothetical protein [Sinomonas sp. ASV322]MDQ4502701.1 hypothetical protein [Sinomonas sp. ASV322]